MTWILTMILTLVPLHTFANDSIFGDDNRVEMTANSFPWSTIGKIYAGGYGCTGTLIGRNLVLTAAHCILDSNFNLVQGTIEFYPNMIQGKSKTSSVATYVTYGSYASSDTYDWAILELKDPLGDQYGYMGVRSWIDDLPFAVHSAGYSGDFAYGLTAGVHIGCFIQEETSMFNHDCDQTKGSSGGPLFIERDHKAYIVGIMVSEHTPTKDKLDIKNQYPYSSRNSNHAVRSIYFQKYVSPLRQKFENQQKTVAYTIPARAPTAAFKNTMFKTASKTKR